MSSVRKSRNVDRTDADYVMSIMTGMDSKRSRTSNNHYQDLQMNLEKIFIPPKIINDEYTLNNVKLSTSKSQVMKHSKSFKRFDAYSISPSL